MTGDQLATEMAKAISDGQRLAGSMPAGNPPPPPPLPPIDASDPGWNGEPGRL